MIGAFGAAVLGSKKLKVNLFWNPFRTFPPIKVYDSMGMLRRRQLIKRLFTISKYNMEKRSPLVTICCICMNRYLSFACSSWQYTLILFVCKVWMRNITWLCVGRGKDGQLLQDFPFCFNVFEDWRFRCWQKPHLLCPVSKNDQNLYSELDMIGAPPRRDTFKFWLMPFMSRVISYQNL